MAPTQHKHSTIKTQTLHQTTQTLQTLYEHNTHTLCQHSTNIVPNDTNAVPTRHKHCTIIMNKDTRNVVFTRKLNDLLI